MLVYNDIRRTYLSLHPPIFKKKDNLTVYFSDEEIKYSKNCINDYTKDQETNLRIKLIRDSLISNEGNPEVQKKIYELLWNEVCGLVKNEINDKADKLFFNECVSPVWETIQSKILKYEPSMNFKFTTFIYKAIQGEISKANAQEKYGTSKAGHIQNISKVSNALLSLNINVDIMSDSEILDKLPIIANETGLSTSVTLQTIRRIQNRNHSSIYDNEIYDNTSQQALKFESPEEHVIKEEIISTVRNALDKLNDTEKRVITLIYDLDGNAITKGNKSTRSISSVAKILGLTDSDTKIIKNSAFRKLQLDNDLRELFTKSSKSEVLSSLVTSSKTIENFYDFSDEDDEEGLFDYEDSESTNIKLTSIKESDDDSDELKW